MGEGGVQMVSAKDFFLPKGMIYMAGHSLGPMPRAAQKKLDKNLEIWGSQGVQGWGQGWFDLPQVLSHKMARFLGVQDQELTLADSTSVNLYKALQAAWDLIQPGRTKILTTSRNFPADLYVLQGLKNGQLCVVEPEELWSSLDETVAILTLTHIDFRTSEVYDGKAITQKAKEKGIQVVWDLSHSIGIYPVCLGDWDTDFAVGCTYKYVSGGPGSPSFIYVNRRLHGRVRSPIWGWLGQKEPFGFQKIYEPKEGAHSFASGTPGILSFCGLESSLELLEDIFLTELYGRAVEEGRFFTEGLQRLGFQIPGDISLPRGGHRAFIHDEGYGIAQALMKEEGVICDYRHPGLVRFCINPLYLERQDLEKALVKLAQVMERKAYQAYPFPKSLTIAT